MSSNIEIAASMEPSSTSPLTKLKSLSTTTKVIIAAIILVVILIVMYLLKKKMDAPEGYSAYMTGTFQDPRFGFSTLMKKQVL